MSDKFELINPYIFPGLKFVGELSKKKYGYIGTVGTSMTKEDIMEIVAKECSVTVEDIVSKFRTRRLVEPRMIITKVLREKLNCTYDEVGLVINREHSSVMNLEQNFKDDYEKIRDFKEKTDRVFKMVNFTL